MPLPMNVLRKKLYQKKSHYLMENKKKEEC